jgi:hypothetical protein
MTRQATVSLIPTKPLSGPLVGVTSVRADFVVERRGFEPLTSAVQAPACFTAPPLPILQGLLSKARRWIPP